MTHTEPTTNHRTKACGVMVSADCVEHSRCNRNLSNHEIRYTILRAIAVVLLAGVVMSGLVTRVSNAQIMCAPNSLPRTCAGSPVCTINGNCGMLQSIICCVTSLGFPTNTPPPRVTQIPIPTDLPTFPPPTSTPIPTPSIYAGSMTPWYTQNLSTSGEQLPSYLYYFS
jgi:hypothetical protein